MTGSLSPSQVEEYHRDGYLFPVDCLTRDEVRHYRGCLEAFEREQADTFGRLPNLVRSKSHLLFTWMDALVRHPKVLDAVESDPLPGSLNNWHHVSSRDKLRRGNSGPHHPFSRPR